MSFGMTVMIHQLFGGDSDSESAIQQAIGRKIASVSVSDVIRITFEDGSVLTVRDDGQSCCESRYLLCDDDLASFGGDVLMSVEVRDGETQKDPEFGDEHETMFVEFTTERGSFTVCTHNEHNGFYGGFVLRAEFSAPASE